MGQVTAGTGPSIFACVLPPASQAVFTSLDATADVYVGIGTAPSAVGTANSTPISPYAPLVIPNSKAGAAVSLYCITGSDDHVVGWVVSTGL